VPVINANALEAGHLMGQDHGATISLILDNSGPGQGPRLHRHPYDETWVIEEGTLTFQLGGEQISVGPGDIVIAPPNTPYKFTNTSAERSKAVCIHASPTMITEWLE
jgi:mannose-6-phosphate isomerase-like protein (cupin superfamily)